MGSLPFLDGQGSRMMIKDGCDDTVDGSEILHEMYKTL